jgi:hypothetical protein
MLLLAFLEYARMDVEGLAPFLVDLDMAGVAGKWHI